MSELHSENYRARLALTVRVKLVDLNRSGIAAISAHPIANHHTSAIVNAASTGVISEGPSATLGENRFGAGSEICIASGLHVPSADFENHIEECPACSNRVELQLDFMQTLELAVYQRKAEPRSKKVGGALLVSAPMLNFAICGELER